MVLGFGCWRSRGFPELLLVVGFLCIQGPRVKLGWAKVSHPGLACLLGATWNLLGGKVELSCALRIQGCC